MTRGVYNKTLPEWLQDIARIHGVEVNSDSEYDQTGSVYTVEYGDEQLLLKDEQRGVEDEVATILSGDDDKGQELAEQTGRYLDRRPKSRSVIIR